MYVVFAIDNDKDLHTNARFLRYVDECQAMMKMKGKMQRLFVCAVGMSGEQSMKSIPNACARAVDRTASVGYEWFTWFHIVFERLSATQQWLDN